MNIVWDCPFGKSIGNCLPLFRWKGQPPCLYLLFSTQIRLYLRDASCSALCSSCLSYGHKGRPVGYNSAPLGWEGFLGICHKGQQRG